MIQAPLRVGSCTRREGDSTNLDVNIQMTRKCPEIWLYVADKPWMDTCSDADGGPN